METQTIKAADKETLDNVFEALKEIALSKKASNPIVLDANKSHLVETILERENIEDVSLAAHHFSSFGAKTIFSVNTVSWE